MRLKKCLISYLYSILCLSLLSCSANNRNIDSKEPVFDTIVLNKHTICISPITEFEYNEIKNSHKIDYDTTPIIKTNGVLILPLAKNKKVILKDSLSNTDFVEQVTYEYIGFIKEVDLYIVSAQFYETGEILLINYKTGLKTKMWSIPKLSPDRKRLVAWSGILDYDLMPNGIQMWSIQKDGELKLEWEYTQNKWEPYDVKWTNNYTINVIKIIPDFLSPSKKDEKEYIKLLIK